MKKSFVFSVLFHLTLLAAALVGFDWFRSDPPPAIMPVEVVNLDDLADVSDPEPELEPEPEEEPEPEPQPEPEPARVAEEPEPVRQAEAAAEPAPEPAPEPDVETDAPPQRVSELVPNLRPRDKPTPPSRLDTSRIAALLDKREAEETPRSVRQIQVPDAPSRNRSDLDAARIRASLQQAIAQQVGTCWVFDAGAREAETLVIQIRIQLHRNGELARMPVIMDSARMRSDSFFRAAAEAARRAVQRCAPLDLPQEDYDLWRDVVLNFDPSKIL